jgi:hypothetical protein
MTIMNVVGSGSLFDNFLYFQIIDNGNATVDSLYFIENNIGLMNGVTFAGRLHTLSISNSVFYDCKVGNENTLIDTGEFHRLELRNLTFTKILDDLPTDSGNTMIFFNYYNISKEQDCIVNDIVIEESTIVFLEINDLIGKTSVPVFMNFTNIAYRNCNFEYDEHLIEFTKMEMQEDINIFLTNFAFSNLTFQRGGSLIEFSQQLANPVTFVSLTVKDVYQGLFHLEASNKLNLAYSTKVKIINSSFESINSHDYSFIELNQGGNLEIINSTFNQISSIENGAVIYAGYQETIVKIYNSRFTNCTAITGALFHASDQSVIKCENWTMISNFAVHGGIMYAENNGYFEFRNWFINFNYALIHIIAEIISSPTFESRVDSSTIHSNSIIDSASFYDEINIVCRVLCFLPSAYRTYLAENPQVYNLIQNPYLFEVISSILIIQNWEIYNQRLILTGLLSTISVENSHISNFTSSDDIFQISTCSLTLSNTSIQTIAHFSTNYLILASFESSVVLSNITYSSSSMAILMLANSNGLIDSCTFTNISSEASPILIRSSNITAIKKSKFVSIFTQNSSYPFRMYNSEVGVVEDVEFLSIQQCPLFLNQNKVTSIIGLKVSEWQQGIVVQKSQIKEIRNSTFRDLGNQSVLKGGAVNLIDSNVTIQEWVFENNTAVKGGAIYFEWTKNTKCFLNLNRSNFTSNYAHTAGGAIMYDAYRPDMSELNFENNTAIYGPNIGSYAIKLNFRGRDYNFNITLDDVTSGQTLSESLVFEVKDYDNQTLIIDSSSTISFRSNSPRSSVINGFVRVLRGVATFNSLIFISNPGSSSRLFSLVTTGIDLVSARKQLGSGYSLQRIIVNYRFCKPGEMINTNIWAIWTTGSFSLLWNSTTCEAWVDNAYCPSSEVINVDSGYWRKNTNSTLIIECPNKKAWKGGYFPRNIHPVSCSSGYDGVLWSKWVTYNGNKYEKTNEFSCSKCRSGIFIILRIIAITWAYLLIIIFIIYLRKKEGNQRTVLMRIMANYSQIMAATMSYNMKLPDVLMQMLSPLQIVSSGSKSGFSMDCFSSDSQFKLFFPSTTTFRLVILSLLPLIFTLLLAPILAIPTIIKKTSREEFKRNITVGFIVILFLLHPTLTDSSLSMFQCMQVDENDFRVKFDLDIKCYSQTHILWWFIVSIPVLIVWVIGSQVVILWILIKNRQRLKSNKIKIYFQLLYQGYREKIFFWEFVNTLKKFLLVSISVFLARYNPTYRGLSAVIVLVAIWRFQVWLKPYVLKVNNEVENYSMVAIGFTIFGGLIFIDNENEFVILEIITFILIIVVNFVYLMFWWYLMSKTYENYHAANKIGKIFYWKHNA